MILRSITKHVKDQNMFAVAVDFFIMALRVFVGLQVANWNNNSQSKKIDKASTEILLGELTSNNLTIESC